MSKKTPDPLAGLGARARAFHDHYLSDEFQLDQHERELLLEAARTLDLCDRLQAQLVADDTVMSESSQGPRVHPVIVELRAQRQQLARLLSALDIPAEDDVDVSSGAGVYRLGGAS